MNLKYNIQIELNSSKYQNIKNGKYKLILNNINIKECFCHDDIYIVLQKSLFVKKKCTFFISQFTQVKTTYF